MIAIIILLTRMICKFWCSKIFKGIETDWIRKGISTHLNDHLSLQLCVVVTLKKLKTGPWLWSNGQNTRLLLLQYEFESQQSLHLHSLKLLKPIGNNEKETSNGQLLIDKGSPKFEYVWTYQPTYLPTYLPTHVISTYMHSWHVRMRI